MNPELVLGADFDGYFGIPIIKKPEQLIIPTGITPFSARNRAELQTDAIGFYELDNEFAEVLISPEKYVDEFCKHLLITPEKIHPILSPDCSLYRNAPLAVQIANVYRNRAIGSYYQRKGGLCNPSYSLGK